MKSFKILLAEDDAEFAKLMCDYFTQEAYVCKVVENGEKAIEALQQESFSLCILDVSMPERDGFEVASYIVNENLDLPFIFCSQRSERKYRLHGLRLGAEDYLAKPIDMEELLLKVGHIKKRVCPKSSDRKISSYSFGNFYFDYGGQILRHIDPENGEINTRKLTTKERELLRIFCEKKNEIVTREEILRSVWKNDDYFNARSMDVYITRLRKYLQIDSSVSLVNQHGVGFRLSVPERL